MRESGARRAAHRWGLRAETIAAFWLQIQGWRVLARRFSAAGGEIDLVVMRGDVVAFVEVKARGEFEVAEAAIDSVKRRRVSRAARSWLARNPWAATRTLRGDAVFVAPRRLPRHRIDAYMLDVAI